MLLEVLNNSVPEKILNNYYLLIEGFRSSQIVSLTKFVVVSSVGMVRVDCIQ